MLSECSIALAQSTCVSTFQCDLVNFQTKPFQRSTVHGVPAVTQIALVSALQGGNNSGACVVSTTVAIDVVMTTKVTESRTVLPILRLVARVDLAASRIRELVFTNRRSCKNNKIVKINNRICSHASCIYIYIYYYVTKHLRSRARDIWDLHSIDFFVSHPSWLRMQDTVLISILWVTANYMLLCA